MKRPTPQDPQARLEEIIHRHFEEARGRLDHVLARRFHSPRAVIYRHARNARDIPQDLLVIPRQLANLAARVVLRRKGGALPRTGKAREVERIVAEELLDLEGLARKIEEALKPGEEEFSKALEEVLGQVPASRQAEFATRLERGLEGLRAPVEGVREAVIFLAAGLVGRRFGPNVVFGSSLSAGQAVAASLYLSQASTLSWAWASVFGPPAWVTAAGYAGGAALAILLAPALSPAIELGVNRLRARRVLTRIIDQAEGRLTNPRPDGLALAGRLAVYLQTLPDALELTRRAARAFF